jgi:hypothetical protein
MFTPDMNIVCTNQWLRTGCAEEHRYIDILDDVARTAQQEARRFNAQRGIRITSLENLSEAPEVFCWQLARRLTAEYDIEVTAEEIQQSRTLDQLGYEIFEEIEEARCETLFPL